MNSLGVVRYLAFLKFVFSPLTVQLKVEYNNRKAVKNHLTNWARRALFFYELFCLKYLKHVILSQTLLDIFDVRIVFLLERES